MHNRPQPLAFFFFLPAVFAVGCKSELFEACQASCEQDYACELVLEEREREIVGLRPFSRIPFPLNCDELCELTTERVPAGYDETLIGFFESCVNEDVCHPIKAPCTYEALYCEPPREEMGCQFVDLE